MNEPAADPGKESGEGGYARFIILSAARTGSNLLATALNGHANIICFRELFNWRTETIGYFVEGYDNDSAEDRAFRDRDEVAFLNARIFCDHPRQVRTVGFKAPYGTFIGFPKLQEWLVQEKEVRILHLRRRNLLRRLVSGRIAEATGAWFTGRNQTAAGKLRLSNIPGALRHPVASTTRLWRSISSSRQRKLARPLLTLTPEECDAAFRKEELRSAQFAQLFADHPVHDLYYEDLTRDQSETLAGVQRFLDVEPARLTPTTARQNPEPLRQLIGNYDELRSAFRGTADEAFFE